MADGKLVDLKTVDFGNLEKFSGIFDFLYS